MKATTKRRDVGMAREAGLSGHYLSTVPVSLINENPINKTMLRQGFRRFAVLGISVLKKGIR